ncbi:MAG: ATP-dependent DNA helicase RecQ [Solirubrobacteraceae bacterium]|nr:ATP-dependent DNA helicase RecQ [Solirubrobacteraceae bacterium]
MAGQFDPALEEAIVAARRRWTELSAQERDESRELAQLLGARVKERPPATTAPRGWNQSGAAAEAPADDGHRIVRAAAYDGPLEPDALLAHIGLSGFRPGQREAVQAALDGQDSLVVMPTGGGKSLCYQLPGLARPGLTVVVSPLIALMADQLRRLTADGHPAVMVASGMGEEEARAAYEDLRSGYARIVFCSPERFASPAFVGILEQRGVDLFVIDEAHCLAEWGHDFRPDYLRLPAAIQRLGRPPVMAATATATEAVAAEIVGRLQLRDPVMIRSGFDRPNLSFDVVGFEGKGTKDGKRALLLGALSDPELRPAIVYCGTRKDCEEVADLLRGDGIRAQHYHAGLASEARAGVQRGFMQGDLEVIVATNAFGMGVDKADVRLVCHWAMPTSVEAYYQEAGRGGRDGAPARALLLASRADLSRLIHFNEQRAVEPEAVEAYHRRLLARSDDRSVVEMDAPDDDAGRISLAIVERSGGAVLSPIGGGRLAVQVRDELDDHSVRHICRESVDRGWRAYRAIERYAFGDSCRRRTLLDHFGDTSEGAPFGRCCDVCDPDLQLAPPKALPGRSSRSRSGGAPQEPSPYEPDPEIYAALVAWRREAAADKPAYTVATNRTLEALADVRPGTEAELSAIKGVGPAFLERYADDVLEIVSAG